MPFIHDSHHLNDTIAMSQFLRRCSTLLRPSNSIQRGCFNRCLQSDSSGYDGDGKTTVSVMNRDERYLILIDTYSSVGFRLNSGLFVMGPIALFPRTIFHWDVNSVADVNVKSLSLFWMVEPKVDILVIGTGDEGLTIDQETRIFLKQKNISCEIMSSAKAAATFNFLNADNRNVAAALIPPTVDPSVMGDHAFDTKAARKTLFKLDRTEEIKDREYYRWNKAVLEYEKTLFQKGKGSKKDLPKLDKDKES